MPLGRRLHSYKRQRRQVVDGRRHAARALRAVPHAWMRSADFVQGLDPADVSNDEELHFLGALFCRLTIACDSPTAGLQRTHRPGSIVS